MKIDGIELLRMFEKGEVNNKTKIKCIDWVTDCWTEVHFNQKGILKWDVSNIALTQEHLKYHFEIIEEGKEIEELPEYADVDEKTGLACGWSFQEEKLKDKINELIKEVNKLKKEGK